MRYEIKFLEDNKVVVTDTVINQNYYGSVVNGYARSTSRLSMQIISKALRENGLK
jgi:hypothetical protein